MVAVGHFSGPMDNNKALNPLTVIKLRDKDHKEKMKWNASVDDALMKMGERQFFLKQPPAAPERTDCASTEYPMSEYAEAQIVYKDAMKDWWQINDTIYELMEASIDLDGNTSNVTSRR